MAAGSPSSSCDTMRAMPDPNFCAHRPPATSGRAAGDLPHPASGEGSKPSSRQDLIDALRLVGRGDQAGFRTLYAATSVKLFGVVLRILGRRDLAEDVLQE